MYVHVTGSVSLDSDAYGVKITVSARYLNKPLLSFANGIPARPAVNGIGAGVGGKLGC